MKQAEEILRMIEGVDPADMENMENMEHIDAHVFCFIHELGPLKYVSHRWSDNLRGLGVKFTFPDGTEGRECVRVKFSRSRDALKAIRPEKVSITITSFPAMHHGSCTANYWMGADHKPFGEHWTFKSPDLPTEELAELHAIIQAIAFEREKNGGAG